MPVAGVGGLLGNMFFPGLDDRMAQHITPNPNPLAQQGGPAQPGQVDQLGNLAPPAVTAPDPANAANVAALTQPSNAYARDAMAVARRDAMAQGVNSGLEQIAAGFGTAQQQASKQAALRGGGGGVGNSLADLAGIQAMQDQTIKDNEHSRFMGNAAIFAQTLSTSLGRPVSVQEATEIMNNPDLMKQFGGAAAANAQTPDKLKEADAEARAWADAHPGATPQEIAQHKSDFLAQTAGGLSGVGKELAEDRRNWHNDPANKGKTDAEMVAERPELADEVTYVAIKGEQAKVRVAAGQDKLNATASFHTIEPTLSGSEANIEWLNDPAHHAAVVKAIQTPEAFTTNAAGNIIAKTGFGGIDADVLSARSKINWLKKNLYADRFSGTKNIRSNTEANNLGAAASNLDTQTNSEDDITTELNRLLDNVYTSHGNLYASAGKTVPKKYDGLVDTTFLDKKSPLYNNGSQEAAEEPPSDILKKAQARIAANPDERDDLVRFFRRQGFKTDKL